MHTKQTIANDVYIDVLCAIKLCIMSCFGLAAGTGNHLSRKYSFGYGDFLLLKLKNNNNQN